MTSGIQSSVISRNIAGATATGYSRKLTVLDNHPGAGVYVAAIQRAASSGLYSNVLSATSSSTKQTAIYEHLREDCGFDGRRSGSSTSRRRRSSMR